MGMRINMNVAQFKEQLQATTNELQKATRPAAQAGAQIIYDAARLNAPVSKRPHKFYGTHKVYGPYAPGNLRDSIYQVFSKTNSYKDVSTYHISWNATKAPHGHLVEWGYIKRWQSIMINGKWVTLKNRPLATPVQVPGKAFVRRAKDAMPQAQEAMRAKFLEVLHGG